MAVRCCSLLLPSVAACVASWCLILLTTGTSGAPSLWTLQQLAGRTGKTTPEAGILSSSGPASSSGLSDGFACELCTLVSEALRLVVEIDASEEAVAQYLALPVCTLMKIEDENVCSLVVEEYKNEVMYVANYMTFGRVRLACNLLLGPDCAAPYDPFQQRWNVSVPGGKPPVKPIPAPKDGAPVSRILHVSDIHWDQNYTPGLDKDCGEPLCCRPPNKPMSDSRGARKWGEPNCDLPKDTLDNFMEHLAATQDSYDWVYLTGDLPAHNVWNQTRQDQTYVIQTIASLFKKYLPTKKVYFTLGNHEGVPCDSFPPPFAREKSKDVPLLQWLLDVVGEAWSPWLSDSALKTLRFGGFYNDKVHDGLRVISLNTNFANRNNFWLLVNDTDPFGQLDWLVQQLLQAEREGVKVHIIGHIPPSQLTYSFGRNYHRIVNRFESTIAGQFFGHTHHDEFQVFFDDANNKTRATSVALIGPSITGFGDMNGGYRIYKVDGNYSQSSNVVLDFTATYMNTTAANLDPDNYPLWLQEYAAKSTYEMKNLQPAAWAELVQRFSQDDHMFQQYYRFKYKLHNPSATCTGSCKAGELCTLLTSQSGDHSHCDQFLSDSITMDDLRHQWAKHRNEC